MQNGRVACWAIALVSACSHPNYEHTACGPNLECPDGLRCGADLFCKRPVVMIDAGVDSSPDTPPPDTPPPDIPPPDAQQCFGSYLNVCLSALPTMPITISATDSDLDVNTDPGASASPLCDPGILNYCVVAATSITIVANKKIRGHGARPLVFVAVGAFELFGEIDVSSSTDGAVLGAGASPSICAGMQAATQNSGGFGGSFGGRGGEGEQVSGEQGIPSAAIGFPPSLRGGCPGGAGGMGGLGGAGGGAVGIFGATVHIDGNINASGAGGRGGPRDTTGSGGGGGGGGGGSGGMIMLDVPQSKSMLGSAGRLFANGGGGGEGGERNVAGAEGRSSTSPNVAGVGGNSGNRGGKGGDGSLGSDLSGQRGFGARLGSGGGAGGGGAGFIHAVGITGGNVISPPSLDTLPM